MSLGERLVYLLRYIFTCILPALVIGVVAHSLKIMDVALGCIIVMVLSVVFDILLDVLGMFGGKFGGFMYAVCFIFTVGIAFYSIVNGIADMNYGISMLHVVGYEYVLPVGTCMLLLLWTLGYCGEINYESRCSYGTIAGISVGIVFFVLQLFIGSVMHIVSIIACALMILLIVLRIKKYGFPFSH